MRTLILLATVAFLTLPTLAQEGRKADNRREEIEKQRVEFVTQFLKLEGSQAEQFREVYQRYRAEMMKLNEQRRELRRQIRQRKDQLTDDEARQFINQMLELDRQALEVRERYFTEVFSKVISPRKVLLIPVAERQFKKKLLKEMKERRGER